MLGEFYSYPVELIARWLGVDKRTAARYKAGRAVPRPALRLFTLLRDRRVLIDSAWDGWTVQDGTLYTPAGEPLTPGMLTAFPLIHQLAQAREPDAYARLTKDAGEVAPVSKLVPGTAR